MPGRKLQRGAGLAFALPGSAANWHTTWANWACRAIPGHGFVLRKVGHNLVKREAFVRYLAAPAVGPAWAACWHSLAATSCSAT